MLLLGLPLVILELGMGRIFQRGDVEAFGKINPRLRGVGLTTFLAAFFGLTYYGGSYTPDIRQPASAS